MNQGFRVLDDEEHHLKMQARSGLPRGIQDTFHNYVEVIECILFSSMSKLFLYTIVFRMAQRNRCGLSESSQVDFHR